MKKYYLYMAVAAALTLTACSQDDDNLAEQIATPEAGAVAFDTYLSNNTTRAGQTGTMTTSTLQKTGFGIIAWQHALSGDGSSLFTGYDAKGDIGPNFMYNQFVGYEASNWVYSPLKYWPNETDNDRQSPNAAESIKADQQEGVSFFAYAPFVENTTDPGESGFFKFDNDGTAGLTQITSNTASTDPKVIYVVADGSNSASDASMQPSAGVDLLWGVSSGFTYHPVKSNAALQTEAGKPVTNMMKPQLEEKIKFDFNHALARIGLTVVGAFDQQAQGGTLDANTKVTIKSVEITSDKFATKGTLNLNNATAYLAKWESPEQNGVGKSTLVIDNGANSEMNPDLKYNGTASFPTEIGVTSTQQNVIYINDYQLVAPTPTYASGVAYYEKGVEDYAGDFYLKGGSGDGHTYTCKNTYVEGYFRVTEAGSWKNNIEKPIATAEYYTRSGSEHNYVYTHVPSGSQVWKDNGSITYYVLNVSQVTKSTPYTIANVQFTTATYTKSANGDLVYVADAETNVPTGKTYYQITTVAGPYNISANKTAINTLADDAKLYTKSGNSYLYYKTKSEIPVTGAAGMTEVYTIAPANIIELTKDNLHQGFSKTTQYYKANKQVGYFMVIPTTPNRETPATATVKITYYVTTNDPLLEGKTSQVENVISQDVTLEKFTNGKSYNLKLILGLTSVKVDAEVSNWEVGTVESNLPQNLE